MCWVEGRALPLKNAVREITRFLRQLSKETVIAVEATGSYHLVVSDKAFELGLTVFVLNPVDAARYRMALRSRGKTDAIDCELIARFVSKEHDALRPYKPSPDSIRRLRSLVRRRDKAVKARTLLEQSVAQDKKLAAIMKPALLKLADVISKMESIMATACSEIEGHAELASVPSIGVVNQAGLLSTLSVGEFPSADAFVAYCGLDCRPKESGAHIGKRMLTKRGSSILRKNLYMAAMGGCVLAAWKPFYEKQLAKGLSRTQALVALARKIARTVWSVYTYRTKFDCSRISCQNP